MEKKPYKLANGKTALVNVNTAVADLLADFQREDENEARNVRRRNEASIEGMFDETGWEPVDETVDIEGDYIAREETKTLLAAVTRLSDKQRRIVQLYYYEEKTEREIAALFGVSHQAINRQLATIKITLKNFFEKS